MTEQIHHASSSEALEKETMRRVIWRILPFLMVSYLVSIIDRGNIGMASLQMNQDLGLSKTAFGFASSLYFIAYFLFEVPSNLAMQKVGARLWIPRIMISWGIVSMCMALVQNSTSLYIVRFLLGAAEAGFFPGVVLYLTWWIPSRYRARIIASFMVAIPLANFIGSPLSGLILTLDGWLGLRGWHLLFLIEGMPAVLLGIAAYFVLQDRPHQAKWLTIEQRKWLENTLHTEREQKKNIGHISTWQLLKHRHIWLMALIYTGASSAGTTLSVWSPQLLKSYHLDNLTTGLLNAIPYGLASVLMIIWGRSSDRSGERRWHTALTLFMIAAGVFLAFINLSLPATLIILSMILVGAYAMKGPFWALASGWMNSSSAAAGLAAIGAIANLIGGVVMVNAYGFISQHTGSHTLAMLPLAVLCLASGIAVLLIGRSAKTQHQTVSAKSA